MNAISKTNIIKLITIGVLLTAVGFFFACQSPPTPENAKAQPQPKTEFPAAVKFDNDGMLIRPEAAVFREWIYVGTPVTPNDLNNGNAPFPEFHNVYIDPASWAEYKKTGQFRDGTVMVKELTSVGAKSASSGNGYFEGEFTGEEVSVKDTKRFGKESNHWAYFSFGHKYPLADKAKAQAQESCAACHIAGPTQDMVFTQYYPVLRAAHKQP